MKFYFAMLALGLALFSCTDPVAGGSSEETNAIAGVLLDVKGAPVVGAIVSVRSSQAMATSTSLAKVADFTITLYADQVWKDTTDKDGKWHVTPGVAGDYTLVANDDQGNLSLRYFSLQDSAISVSDTLKKSVSFSSTISSRFGSAKGSQIYVLGTDMVAIADSNGWFEMPAVPQGKVLIEVRSSDPYRYADARYGVLLAETSTSIMGPMEQTFNLASMDTLALQAKVLQDKSIIELPLVYPYEVRAWWNFDVLSWNEVAYFTDARGRSGDGVAYGVQSEVGVKGRCLSITGSSDFAVVEDLGTVFTDLTDFSVEAWVKVDRLSDSANYQMNLFGQLGWDGVGDFFSLAVIKNQATKAPRFGFVLSDGKTPIADSPHQLVASQAVQVGEWAHVMATWNGSQACIYVNGYSSACADFNVVVNTSSTQPVVFGKEDMNVLLDEVRIIGAKLEEADAMYRWLRRFE